MGAVTSNESVGQMITLAHYNLLSAYVPKLRLHNAQQYATEFVIEHGDLSLLVCLDIFRKLSSLMIQIIHLSVGVGSFIYLLISYSEYTIVSNLTYN